MASSPVLSASLEVEARSVVHDHLHLHSESEPGLHAILYFFESPCAISQQVRSPTIRLKNLGLILGTCIIEGQNCKLSSDSHKQIVANSHTA